MYTLTGDTRQSPVVRALQSGSTASTAVPTANPTPSGSLLRGNHPRTTTPRSAGLDASRRDLYLRMMLRGSLNVSRTRTVARRFMAPHEVTDEQIPQIAERNFREAAQYMLAHAHELPLTLETAAAFNRVLTRELGGRRSRHHHGDS